MSSSSSRSPLKRISSPVHDSDHYLLEKSNHRRERSREPERRERSRERDRRKSTERGRSKSKDSRKSYERKRSKSSTRYSRERGKSPGPNQLRKDPNESLTKCYPSSPSICDSQCDKLQEREKSFSPSLNRSGTHNQTKAALLFSDEEILKQIENDMKSLSLDAVEELSKRPKNGDMYNEITANRKNIKKRLKYLSENLEVFSIDAAIEIADTAHLLRLLREPNHELEMAGQMAHRGALLMLQADMLSKKGEEVLEKSKNKLKLAISNP